MQASEFEKGKLGLAEYISRDSKDPSTKVGAVVVDKDKRNVSTGYNGFAKKVKDLPERYLDREFKLKTVLHAEENAILFAKQDLTDMELYCTLCPCAHCAAVIIQSGISKVKTWKTVNDRWEKDFEITRMLFRETGVIFMELDRV